MKTKFIEATDATKFNWGKFMIGYFEPAELGRPVTLPNAQLASRRPLLDQIGFDRREIFVADLQTQEGAFFRPGGSPKADLEKHRIWVCPLFEPFLEWL